MEWQTEIEFLGYYRSTFLSASIFFQPVWGFECRTLGHFHISQATTPTWLARVIYLDWAVASREMSSGFWTSTLIAKSPSNECLKSRNAYSFQKYLSWRWFVFIKNTSWKSQNKFEYYLTHSCFKKWCQQCATVLITGEKLAKNYMQINEDNQRY